jgi:hypothetical protein
MEKSGGGGSGGRSAEIVTRCAAVTWRWRIGERGVGTRQPFKLTSTYDSRSLLDPDPRRESPVVFCGFDCARSRNGAREARCGSRRRRETHPRRPRCGIPSWFGNRPAAWPGCSGTRHSAPRRNFSASGYKFTITPCTMKDGPSWGPLARYRRCGPAGGTDLPCTVRSSPRSDGSRRLRFVIDLPPNQLGPSWRKKAG